MRKYNYFSFISRIEKVDVCVYMYVYVYECVCVQICHMKINQLKRGRRPAKGKKKEMKKIVSHRKYEIILSQIWVNMAQRH